MSGENGGSRNGFVVLYAGLHGLAQGLGQILDAAESLRDEKGFRFLLVGDGPEKRLLMRRAEQQNIANVEFVNPVPADEIPALLTTADVLLVPLGFNLTGAVPSKLYEAMAIGRPLVLVANGEAADIVRQHKVGITVTPGDLNGLTDALRRLRAEPALRQQFGDNGRKVAVRHYDRKKIADEFINYLEQDLRLQSDRAARMS
jgi:glycosyltransferase involved in cell wall biosynthesis